MVDFQKTTGHHWITVFEYSNLKTSQNTTTTTPFQASSPWTPPESSQLSHAELESIVFLLHGEFIYVDSKSPDDIIYKKVYKFFDMHI